MAINYSLPGPMTALGDTPAWALEPIGRGALEICRPVHTFFVQPTDPWAAALSEPRVAENQIRPAAELVARLLLLDAAPLSDERDPADRVVGTCRHFAVVACALLQHRGFHARVRCGFATYFEPGQGLDHWIVEHRDQGGDWVRIDPEIIGLGIIENPESLAPEQFLTGGEAWAAFRRGEIDASRFGVRGTPNWGAGEIRGNAVKDLAALNKVEMLPWDEWGRMADAYEDRTGADYDELLDRLAEVCAGDDSDEIAAMYTHEDLRVPAELIV